MVTVGFIRLSLISVTVHGDADKKIIIYPVMSVVYLPNFTPWELENPRGNAGDGSSATLRLVFSKMLFVCFVPSQYQIFGTMFDRMECAPDLRYSIIRI